MDTPFALELPLGGVSFGQVSINILLELYKRQISPCLFPIGQVDLSAHNKLSEDFKFWLNGCIDRAWKYHKRNIPIIKLWHMQNSLGSYSEKQILFTFYELDQPTPIELNIVKNQKKVIFSSNYSKDIFSNYCDNTEFVPLGFDSLNFYQTNKKYLPDEITVFTLAGKMEKRKHHAKILSLWAKRFGNDRKYFLNCALFNPFMKVEDQEAFLRNALEGKKYFNINFLPYMQTNEAYNDFLNCGNLDLTGLSGSEGWNLPSFQQVCLGKHAIVLNAHAHKDWATKENSFLVNPNGMEDAYDNIFFRKGTPYNQGRIFTWNPDEVISKIEEALPKAKSVNSKGLELAKQFTYENTVNKLLQIVESL